MAMELCGKMERKGCRGAGPDRKEAVRFVYIRKESEGACGVALREPDTPA